MSDITEKLWKKYWGNNNEIANSARSALSFSRTAFLSIKCDKTSKHFILDFLLKNVQKSLTVLKLC